NKASYLKLQGGEEEVTKIINSLKVKSKKSKINRTNWLDKMAHGQTITNAYVRPVVFISTLECNTFLPLRAGPKDDGDSIPFYLLHVNGYHWTLATVGAIDGITLIPPPILAPRSSSKDAKCWLGFISKGLSLCK
ncbi:hypothetical protein PSHT_12491, partial [Puccinia striiformis]